MAVVSSDTVEGLYRPLANFVADCAAAAVKERGRFTVALSGGSLPKVRAAPPGPRWDGTAPGAQPAAVFVGCQVEAYLSRPAESPRWLVHRRG